MPAEESRRGGRRRRLAGRVGWGLGDQALSSLTNFGLTVFAAHALGRAGFGVFGLLFATYLVCLGVSRALCSEPLSVRFTAVSAPAWRHATAEATGLAMVVGVVAGCVLAAGSLFLRADVSYALLAFAVLMPGLLLQDSWRYAFFAQGRGGRAVMNDLVWALTQAVAIALVAVVGSGATWQFVAAWGLAANTAAVVGSVQAGVRPAPWAGRGWLRDQRDLGLPYLGEFVGRSAGNIGTLYATGILAGLAAAGAYRGAQALVTPITLVNMGLVVFGIPEAVRASKESPHALWRVTAGISVSLVVVSVVWGCLLFMLPATVGHQLLNHQWESARRVVIPLSCAWAAVGVITGATVGLRALAAARRSLRLRLPTAVVTLCGGAGGAAVAGAPGAAVGFALGMAVTCPFWWLEFRAALREHASAERAIRMVPIPSTSSPR
jgi:O-antigen/teichoic acid export membrane protein